MANDIRERHRDDLHPELAYASLIDGDEYHEPRHITLACEAAISASLPKPTGLECVIS